MIPLFHDFADRRVVIFGGGSVAARKTALFGPEADVVVISSAFVDRFESLQCQLVRADITRPLIEAFMAAAFLVIPATDDASLNEQIESAAREQGCLVNSVDHPGNTVTPSIIDGKHVSIAISTEGKSPAVSKYLRKRLEPEIERVDEMAEIQAIIRDELADAPSDEKRETLWEILDDDQIWDALEAGEENRAESLAREHI